MMCDPQSERMRGPVAEQQPNGWHARLEQPGRRHDSNAQLPPTPQMPIAIEAGKKVAQPERRGGDWQRKHRASVRREPATPRTAVLGAHALRASIIRAWLRVGPSGRRSQRRP